MEFKIRLENGDPPSGWIVVVTGPQEDRRAPEDAGRPVRFSGWLGLLQALDDAVGCPHVRVANRARH